MRGMLQLTGRHVVEQRHPNDFADMLGDIFSGNFGWAMDNRTGDDLGLVAELLKHAPEGYLEALLDVFRHAFNTGQIPTSWQTTIWRCFQIQLCEICIRFSSHC